MDENTNEWPRVGTTLIWNILYTSRRLIRIRFILWVEHIPAYLPTYILVVVTRYNRTKMLDTSGNPREYRPRLKDLLVFLGTIVVGSTFVLVSVQVKEHKENSEGFRENIAPEKLSGFLRSQNLDDNLR